MLGKTPEVVDVTEAVDLTGTVDVTERHQPETDAITEGNQP